MICPRCGTQLITGSRVCMACGQNVSYISNPTQAPASSAGTFPTAPTAPKLFFILLVKQERLLRRHHLLLQYHCSTNPD